jgi:hypothetical protein
MFRHRPELAAELLTVAFGLSLPSYDHARLGSGELTPIEHRADTVVELRTGKTPVLAVVVEVQLSRDPAKRFSWPVYQAVVRARLRCPTALLVICPDAATAAWCASTIQLGPTNTFTPIVLGPRQIPRMTDPYGAADNPELAVLSAMAHGGRADQDKVLHTVPAALLSVDDQHAKLYYDLVLAALPAAARRHLEELMTTAYQYQSDFARKYVAEGEAVGRAEGEAVGRAQGEAVGRAQGEVTALLTVLAARGIDVPGDDHARITGCTDLDQLTTWLRRAATADSIHDVLL